MKGIKFIKSFVLVSVLGLGILLLPQSISSPNSTPPSTSNTDIVENSIEAATSVDSRTSGTTAGWSVDEPFEMRGLNTMYVGTDGYLYAAGYNTTGAFGNGTIAASSTFIKLYKNGESTNYFKNPINYSAGTYTTFVIDSDGKAWSAGGNAYGGLGRNGTTNQNTFGLVSTSTATNYLPADYKAVKAVNSGSSYRGSILLTDTGALYGAGQGNILGLDTTATTNSTFRRLDGVASGLPASTNVNKIHDIGTGEHGSYVLYDNGDLYATGAASIGKWVKIASNIAMFDIDVEGNSSQYVYAVTFDNKVMYSAFNSASMTLLNINPVGTIIQIRDVGNGKGWGYLNDANDLYLSTTANGTPVKQDLGDDKVVYFDADAYAYSSGSLTYGVMTEKGEMKFWGWSSFGSLGNGSTSSVTYDKASSPTNSTYPSTMLPDLGNGLSRSNPPAINTVEYVDSVNDKVTALTDFEYGEVQQIPFGTYYTFNYDWYVKEKIIANNKDQYIDMTITGLDETNGEPFNSSWRIIADDWTNNADYATPIDKDDLPSNLGEYKFSAQLVEMREVDGEDLPQAVSVGSPYEFDYEIIQDEPKFELDTTAIDAFLSDFLLENNGRDTYGLITNEFVNSIKYTNYIDIMPKVFNYYDSATGQYVTQSNSYAHWNIYIADENGLEVQSDDMPTHGKFKIVFEYAPDNDNYTEKYVQEREFTIVERTFDLINNNLGINENENLYNQSAFLPQIEFGVPYYVNLNNSVYQSNESGNTVITITVSQGDDFSFTFVYGDLPEEVYKWLPKAQGTYTITATVVYDGHTFEETITSSYTIIKASPVLTITDELAEQLSATVLNSSKDSIDDLNNTVMDAIWNSWQNSDPIFSFSPALFTLSGTTLTAFNLSQTHQYDQWTITYTGRTTSTPITTFQNRYGLFTAHITFNASAVNSGLNYNDVKTVSINFELKERSIDKTIEFGITAYDANNNNKYNDNQILNTIPFGENYVVNIADSTYDGTQTSGDTQVLTVSLKNASGNLSTIYYNDGAETTNGNGNDLPKNVGTYVIRLTVSNNGHEYGYIETEYTITQSKPVLEINQEFTDYLAGVEINNNGDTESDQTILLYNQMYKHIADKLLTYEYVTIQNLKKVASGGKILEDYNPATDAISSNWTIYFTTGGSTGTKQTKLSTGTRYYAWVQFVTSDGNYVISDATAAGNFVVESRQLVASNNMIGITTEANKYQGTNLSTISFGNTYYLNIATRDFDETGYHQVFTIAGTGVEFDYNNNSTTHTEIWDYLPKNGGKYTITLTIKHEDGHAYGAMSKDYTITTSDITINYDIALRDVLSDTALLGSLNLVDTLREKIIGDRENTSYDYISIISPSELFYVVEDANDSNKTYLQSYTLENSLEFEWDIDFTGSNQSTVVTTINGAGSYFARVRLINLGGYNDSARINIPFTLSGDGSADPESPELTPEDLTEGLTYDFDQDSIGIQTHTNLYSSGNVYEIGFSETYYVNLSSKKYSETYRQKITITDIKDTVYATYYYDDTTKDASLFAKMPKSIGTYTIKYELVSKENSNNVLAVVRNTFEIKTAVAEMTIAQSLIKMLEETEVFIVSGEGKELIDDMLANVLAAVKTSGNMIFAPTLQSLNGLTLSPINLATTTTDNWSIVFTDASATTPNTPLTSITNGGEFKVWIGLKGIAGYEDIAPVSATFTIDGKSIEDGFTPTETPETSTPVKPDSNGGPFTPEGDPLPEIPTTPGGGITVTDEEGNTTEVEKDDEGNLILPEIELPYGWEVEVDDEGNTHIYASRIIDVKAGTTLVGQVKVAATKNIYVTHQDGTTTDYVESDIELDSHITVAAVSSPWAWEIYNDSSNNGIVIAKETKSVVDEDGKPVTTPTVTVGQDKKVFIEDFTGEIYELKSIDPITLPALKDGYTSWITTNYTNDDTLISPVKTVTIVDYEGNELQEVQLTPSIKVIRNNAAGTQIEIMSENADYEMVLPMLPEGSTAWEIKVDADGNTVITPTEGGNETFNEDSFGISTSTSSYNSKSIKSIAFGEEYFINISNPAFNSSKYKQEVTYPDHTNQLITVDYNDINKNAAEFSKMPKAVGTYQISLTVYEMRDGVKVHEFGTITTEYTIREAKTHLEIDDNLVYNIEKHKITEEGAVDVFEYINDEIQTGLSNSGRLITMASETGSFKTLTDNVLSSPISFNYDDLTYVIKNSGGTTVTEIKNWGTYTIEFTFAGYEGRYEALELSVEFNVTDRAYYSDSQMGITTSMSNRLELEVGFGTDYIIFFDNREITSQSHTVTFNITGHATNLDEAFSALNINFFEFDLTTETGRSNFSKQLPKAIGTYTVTITLIEKVGTDLVAVEKDMVMTYKITPNDDVSFDGINQSLISNKLATVTASNDDNIMPTLTAMLQNMILNEIQLNTVLYKENGVLSLSGYTADELRVGNYFEFQFYTLQGTQVSGINTAGTYRLVLKFNGIAGLYNETTYGYEGSGRNGIVVTISDRHALNGNDINVNYLGETGDNSSIVFAEDINNRFFITLDRTSSNNSDNNGDTYVFTPGSYDILVAIRDSKGTTYAQYYYFGYTESTIWASMPKNAGTYTVTLSVTSKEDGHRFDDVSSTFTITQSVFDINSVNGNLSNDVSDKLSKIGAGGFDIINTPAGLVEKLDELLTASYFTQSIYTTTFGSSNYTSGDFNLSYTFYNSNYGQVSEITKGGRYFVKVTFNDVDGNYYSSTTIDYLSFIITDLTVLDQDSARFTLKGVQYSTIPFYSGDKYSLTLNGDFKIFDTTNPNPTSLFDIQVNIKSTGQTQAFEVNFDYKNVSEADLWKLLPKFVGTYEVTVVLTETMNGVTYTPSESKTQLEIIGGQDIEFDINSTNVKNALDGYEEKFGDDANIYDELINQLNMDLLRLKTPIYLAELNGSYQIVDNLKTLTMADYNLIITNSKGETMTDSDQMPAGLYTLKIQFKGYDKYYNAATYGTLIQFRIAERATVDTVNSQAFFQLTNTLVSTVEYYNNGERYYLNISGLGGFSGTNDLYVIMTAVVDGQLSTNPDDIYRFKYDLVLNTEQQKDDLWVALPKKVGTYAVAVEVTYDDDYAYAFELETTATIEAIAGLTVTTTAVMPTLQYNKKDLTTAITTEFNKDTVTFTNANGSVVTSIPRLNTVTNEFELDEISTDVLKFTFQQQDENGVWQDVEGAIKLDGDYRVIVELNDEIAAGFETETLSVSQEFTINPYEGSFDWRGLLIAFVAIGAIVAIVVVRKVRR